MFISLIKKEALQIMRSRIPSNIASPVQNKYDFINQKKAIFLVDLETSNLKEEISRIKEKSERKETSLQK